jgi:CheY-like chemotaxis protein
MEELNRILYTEDSMEDIELILTAFQKSQTDNLIDVVKEGTEVLDYLFCRNNYSGRMSGVPCFFRLDSKLQKLDGIKVLKILRESEEFRNLPIVMLTSSTMGSDSEKCYNLRVNGYVVNPMDYDEFIRAIKGIGTFWAKMNTIPVLL